VGDAGEVTRHRGHRNAAYPVSSSSRNLHLVEGKDRRASAQRPGRRRS
jgi:hypothetical protein